MANRDITEMNEDCIDILRILISYSGITLNQIKKRTQTIRNGKRILDSIDAKPARFDGPKRVWAIFTWEIFVERKVPKVKAEKLRNHIFTTLINHVRFFRIDNCLNGLSSNRKIHDLEILIDQLEKNKNLKVFDFDDPRLTDNRLIELGKNSRKKRSKVPLKTSLEEEKHIQKRLEDRKINRIEKTRITRRKPEENHTRKRLVSNFANKYDFIHYLQFGSEMKAERQMSEEEIIQTLMELADIPKTSIRALSDKQLRDVFRYYGDYMGRNPKSDDSCGITVFKRNVMNLLFKRECA